MTHYIVITIDLNHWLDSSLQLLFLNSRIDSQESTHKNSNVN